MTRRTSGKIPGVGYVRQSVSVDAHQMIGRWLVVAEEFDNLVQASGLLIVRPGTLNTVFGRVLRAGPECELDGVKEGDRILFERWAGGRWALKDAEGLDVRVLIMSADSIVARVEEE